MSDEELVAIIRRAELEESTPDGAGGRKPRNSRMIGE
jgi:hypothetical protein